MIPTQVKLKVPKEFDHGLLNLIVDKDGETFQVNQAAILFVLKLSEIHEDNHKNIRVWKMVIFASYENHLQKGLRRCEHTDKLVRSNQDMIRTHTTFTHILEVLDDDAA